MTDIYIGHFGFGISSQTHDSLLIATDQFISHTYNITMTPEEQYREQHRLADSLITSFRTSIRDKETAIGEKELERTTAQSAHNTVKVQALDRELESLRIDKATFESALVSTRTSKSGIRLGTVTEVPSFDSIIARVRSRIPYYRYHSLTIRMPGDRGILARYMIVQPLHNVDSQRQCLMHVQ